MKQPVQKRFQALGRMKKGRMNQTEERYAGILEMRKRAGEILWYEFEPANLRLGEKCYYQVDFMVMTASNELEIHEVKGGYMTDDSLVKIKAAAEKFPFKFLMQIYAKKQWTVREF